MHFSSLLVLSTLAIGQAAAGSPRHASFHARRRADQKRSTEDADAFASIDWQGAVKKAVDWSTVKYDFHGVDWSKVDYGKTAAPTPSAAATSAPAPPPAKPTTKEEAAPPAPTTTKAAATTTKASNPIGDAVGKFVDGLVDDIEGWFADIGIGQMGVNSKVSNGNVWIGSNGDYTATFTNNAGKDLILICWNNQGFTVNTVKPQITVKLPEGKAQKLSFGSFSGACTAVPKGWNKSDFGGLKQTWWEFTSTGNFPTFDVSMEPYMKGIQISSKATKSGCVSDMNQCVFKCTNGQDKCGEAGEYNIVNTGGQGCHSDDAKMNGGCMANAGGDHIEISFS